MQTSLWKLFIAGLQADKKKTFLLVMTIIVGVLFLGWRWFFVMNWSTDIPSVIWGLILYAADFYGFITFLIFSFETLYPIDLEKQNIVTNSNPNYNPSVDIFICTYNEDPDVVRKTAIGCTYINYSNKKIYILDDKNRPIIKELADELGVNYISRANNDHFKAGNINNALRLTNSDLVVNFDADHVPNECFLEKLVNYFQNEKVGLIQTPQHFFNPDPFQQNLDLGIYLSNEQDLFFRVIQPGLSYWNATICCGTNWIARRKALEDIGYIPIDTITEDMATSIKMQELGYKTLYLNKPLAAGLSAENLSEYISQRQRWARGALQILFSWSTPILSKKLNIAQKICYLGAINYYFLGIPRIIYLLAPSMFILFNLFGVVATIEQLLLFQIPYLFFMIYTFIYISQGKRIPILTDTYETTIAYDLTLVSLHSLIRPGKKAKFRVTEKNIRSDTNYFDFMAVLPELIILLILFISLLALPYFAIAGGRMLEALIINGVWLIYNIIVVLITLRVGFHKPQRRQFNRISLSRTFEIQVGFNKHFVTTLNVSEGGTLIEAKDLQVKYSKGQQVDLISYDNFQAVTLEAEVIEHRIVGNRSYLRLKFINTDGEKEKILVKQMYSYCGNWE